MMTEEHIKEAISLRYIELIAAYNGYKTKSSYPDYGTDLDVIEVGFRMENGHKRYSQTGRELKFQFKATTNIEEKRITISKNNLFRLDTLNQLIENFLR